VLFDRIEHRSHANVASTARLPCVGTVLSTSPLGTSPHAPRRRRGGGRSATRRYVPGRPLTAGDPAGAIRKLCRVKGCENREPGCQRPCCCLTTCNHASRARRLLPDTTTGMGGGAFTRRVPGSSLGMKARMANRRCRAVPVRARKVRAIPYGLWSCQSVRCPVDAGGSGSRGVSSNSHRTFREWIAGGSCCQTRPLPL
jgi:hypothetical protein